MRYLLCIIPPLAVLSCGKPGQFLVNCGLTLCIYFPGFFHALGVVHNYYADKRTDRIVNAISKSNPGPGIGIATQPQTAKGGFLMKFILGASLFGAVVVAISNKTPTHADKSASVEQSKPALKPDDKVPPYTVISEETDPATKLWRNVHVRLQEKVSEDDLRRIAQKIKSEKPKISAGQIYYHLPEQTVKLDAKGRVDGFEDWASAVFTPKEVFKFDPNPKLEVTFSGNPKGTLPPKPNGEIVGQWEWNKVGSFETLLRTKEGLKMVTTSGETGKAILNELVTVKKEGNRIIIRPIKKAGHNDGYFWVLDEEKNLLVMDPESNDRMGKAIAIIKPTLKL